MDKLVKTIWLLLMMTFISPSNSLAIPVPVDSESRPNIVLFLTDDQGYGDLGFTGNEIINTPRIDELFNQGVSFNRFYVSPVCSPTRASLLTGKSSLKTGVFHVTRGGEKMLPSLTTLPEYLSKYGYKSGLFGKWHNGLQYPHDPLGQGFDEFYGFSDGHKTRYFDDELQHNTQTVAFEGYIADNLTDKAIEFIEQNKKSHFFAMISFNTPHGPFIAPDKYFKKYKKIGLSDLDASVYGMVENIDDNVGRIQNTIERLSLNENTIFIYLSDNGAAFPKGISRYNAGLKGNKGTVDEGGVRTPFVIKWQNKFAPGKRVEHIAQHIDIVPTILDILGLSTDEKLDGISLLPIISTANNKHKPWPRRAIFTHRFQIAKNSSSDPVKSAPGAIRTQKWLATFNEQSQWQLYNLQDDPGQKNDLSERNRDKLLQLKTQYLDWYNNTTAEYGPYVTQPIEIGHQGFERVELPAHEGLLTSGQLDYQYNDGWAHDWFTNDIKEANKHKTFADVYWPIKVTTPGQYQVSIGYATPNGSYHGKVRVISTLNNAKLESIDQALPSYIPQLNSSPRQFHTDEAVSYKWMKHKVGVISFDNAAIDTDSDIKLNLQLTNQIKSKKETIWIKYLEIEKLN
uniref:arylsulfatase n=1 Tax=Shewanella gaetbuli TaxID=220752 RepID=UPI003B58F891